VSKYGEMKRAGDWEGKRIITIKKLQNGANTIPEGAKGIVTYAHNGLSLNLDGCPFCGVGVRITRVPYTSVRLEGTV